MENKYYTPSIDEFHVGFEYEGKATFQDGSIKSLEEFEDNIKYPWNKYISHTADIPYIDRALNGLNADNNRCGIRVKYLDKDDIESLGFIFTFQEYGGTCSIVGSNNEERESIDFIGIQFEEDWQGILDGPTVSIYNNKEKLFSGVIKNKSELKQILKMIGYEYSM